MEYERNVVYWAVVKHQVADASSRLSVEGMDDYEIDDKFLVMTVAARALMEISDVTNNIPKQTHIKANELQLSTLDDLMSA